jgi:gliding motility-associated-like protein
MKRNIFLLILTFILYSGKLAAQCDVVITNPAAVCFPSTVNLTAPAVTSGSTAGLTFTYWLDSGGSTTPYTTPTIAPAGTYYIKGDNGSGCTQVKPVVVTVNTPPTATISYAGTPYCKSLSTPQAVTLSGTGTYTGGIFSAPAGLSINPSNGSITPSTSTDGVYVVTYTIPAVGACPANPVTTSVTIVAIPTAPVVGAITSPTCTTSTGSVALSGLPSFGDWTITITPGGTTTGSGTSTTVSGLLGGASYTFKVTNYAGCISPSSGSATIPAQPATPTAPIVGAITPPSCTVTTGSVVLSGLPATGTWTVKRYPGSVTTSGTGVSTTISGIPTGTYNYSVTSGAGCVSVSLSDDVVIPAQPATPSPPVIGAIIQPTCSVSTGSVALSGLPASGTWTVTLSSAGTTITGTGTSAIFPAIPTGTYTFTVTSATTCTSAASASAVINAQPATPTPPSIGTITQPTCAVATGTVVLNSLPAGNWVLTRSPGGITTAGTGTSITIADLDPGTHTFTVTNASGCISGSSANVVINAQPPSPGTPVYGQDCTLGFGHAVITVTTPLGTGLTYSLDAGSYQASPVFSNVVNGNHFLAVRNSEGCVTIGGIFSVSCGCVNAPTVVLSATEGSTCGTTPVTVIGNTFGGSATSVTITENGGGSVTPGTSSVSPFSFTYTPVASDRGKIITITVTSNNPLGSPCSAAVVTYALTVNPIPSAPSIGTITNLTCTVITGSVVLNGLPSTGTWSLTMEPGGVITSGTGTSTTVSGLDAGTYNFTVTTEEGCTSASSAPAVISPQPSSPTAPVIGTITHPTCETSTGSVAISGLPATGTWTLTRLPGGSTRTGSGTTVTVTTVPGGTYTYTVANASGCSSPPSESFIIKDQPAKPAAPSVGTITPPTCILATGSVNLMGLPATGTWTLTRYPGTITTPGTGTSTNVAGIATGTYNFTITSEAGCVSVPSANVIIPVQPPTPAAPVVGTITQPTLAVPTGSVRLSGLPSPGAWVLTRLPDELTTAGSGSSFTVAGLPGGLFNFTVTNSYGCVSDSSIDVTISTPGKPNLIITNPEACSPAKADLTAPAVTDGSTTGLIFTYWTDAEATIEYATPATAPEGTYYIKGTTISGYFDIKPVEAIIYPMPVADAGPDQLLALQFNATLAAVLGENETGKWSVESGTGVVADTTDPASAVSKLSNGDNILQWIVTKGVCPADTDKVLLIVGDVRLPTLITPNGDTKNEYFVILGLESLGKTELIIFDRRGAMVFKDSEYDNKWNGVDYNKNPLPNDTYFYLIKPAKNKTLSGYIVVRR